MIVLPYPASCLPELVRQCSKMHIFANNVVGRPVLSPLVGKLVVTETEILCLPEAGLGRCLHVSEMNPTYV